MKIRCIVFSVAVVILWAGATTILAQGSLEPPTNAFVNGNPVAIMKTLDQIEPRVIITNLPFTILLPGSYSLVRPLIGITGTNGITINCSDVKLDLNGFALNGVADTWSAIVVMNGLDNISIRNGVIRGWGRYGVYALSSPDCVVADVKSFGNGWGGIYVGDNAFVERCSAYNNGLLAPATNPPATDGIRMGSYSTIINSKSRMNKGTGIYAGWHARITGCTATQSQDAEGIVAESYSIIKDNVSSKNHRRGIRVASKCWIENNICGENAGLGVVFPPDGVGVQIQGSQNVIARNNSSGNKCGFSASGTATNNLFYGNISVGNSSLNYQIGPGNHIGQILAGTGQSFSNSNPWANFQF